MQITKIFLGAMLAIYILILLLTMIKTKKFFKVIILSALQGICVLFAINLFGEFIQIHIPVNSWTIGISSIGGISGVIMLLLCDIFML